MSSVQDNPAKLADRKPYLRSSSLEKIRCSAYYSLQLAGSILSKEYLMQLFELLITKSRNFLQRAFLLFTFPAFKVCCAVVLFWIDSLTKYTGMDVVFEKKIASGPNVEPEKTYTIKVQKKKTTPPRSPVKLRRSSSTSSSSSSPVAMEANTLTKISENLVDDHQPHQSEPKDQHVPEMDKPVPDVAKSDTGLHPLLQSRLSSSASSLTKSNSERSLLTDSNMSISGRHNFGLVVIVYGSATLVYLQLMFLAAFLNTVHTPPGLLFLVSSLGYIGYIVYKICFVKRKSKEDGTPPNSPTKRKSSTNETVSGKEISNTPADKPARGRLSRLTTRRFLDIHNKTLSKIKLL